MSKASPGGHLVGPDLPVREYSAKLEEVYLNMHRDLCIMMEIPLTLDSASGIDENMVENFYVARELLEQDFGISESLARTIPALNSGPYVAQCYEWATTEAGREMYEETYGEERKTFDTYGERYLDFIDPVNFWHRLRITGFNIGRCLRIIQTRVAPFSPRVDHDHANYFWLEDRVPALETLDDRLDFLFFPLPDQWGLRGDPYLFCHMAQYAATCELPKISNGLQSLIESLFMELTGRSLEFAEDFCCEPYAVGGMSSGYICPKWWQKEALPLLAARFDALLEPTATKSDA